MMMKQVRVSRQQYPLFLLVIFVLTKVITTTLAELTIDRSSSSITTSKKVATKNLNTLELINREIAKLPIRDDASSTTGSSMVVRNLQQQTNTTICKSIQNVVFQNLVQCDCDIAPFNGTLDVACSQSNLCSPQNILCGTAGFNVKFDLFDSGKLTTNLCLSDIKLSLLAQSFGPFCINYNVQVLKTNFRTLCPNGLIACLLGNFGNGGGNTGGGGGNTGGGGGGGGMAAMGTDGGMAMGGGMDGGMGGMGRRSRHRTLLMGARSIISTSTTSAMSTKVSSSSRRVQTTAIATKAVTTTVIAGCNVTVGDVVCKSCQPCDNKGGIKFDCSNAVPGLIQIDTCAKFNAWTDVGTTVKPKLPDLVLQT